MTPRDDAALREALRRTALMRDLSDEQFDDFAPQTRGTQVLVRGGDWAFEDGQAAAFHLVLEGSIEVLHRTAHDWIPITRFEAGAHFGEVPMLLERDFFAHGRALTDCWLFRLDESAFWEMLGECPVTSRRIFRLAAARLQTLEGITQAQERVRSLGVLAAGMAHELNNPASAARRAAHILARTAAEIQEAVCDLASRGLGEEVYEVIHDKRQEAIDHASVAGLLSPLTQPELEDEIAQWLEAHGVADGYEMSTSLVLAGLGTAWLESINQQVPANDLVVVVRWLELNVRARLTEIELDSSLERISGLVGAMKEYSYLDQSPEQEIDVHRSLDNVVQVLPQEIQGTEIVRDFDRSLPRVQAHGPDLVEMFTQLLLNAAKAGTRITLRTRQSFEYLVVEVCDNGPGIPAEVRAHMFEPFFSTRGVGAGRGLGLVHVYRIAVGRLGGRIEYETGAGGTTFHIYIPIVRHHQAPARLEVVTAR